MDNFKRVKEKYANHIETLSTNKQHRLSVLFELVKDWLANK